MLASALIHKRITLEEAKPVVEKAIALAERQAELRQSRGFLAMMTAYQAFAVRAAEEARDEEATD